MTDLQIPKLHFEALRIFHARASNLFSTFSQFFYGNPKLEKNSYVVYDR